MNIAIIGAGASGLMAGYAAASHGAKVTVFEKNEKPGKKIYITGKGRCNVTNACDSREFFENIVSNPKFMYNAFYRFSNVDLMRFIEANGTRLKVERGKRVFPVSDHASDITKALLHSLEDLDVKFRFNNIADEILLENIDCNNRENSSLKGNKKSKQANRKVVGLECSGEKLNFDSIILASGGASYPGAGGSTIGYDIAKRLKLQVTEITPSLVPFIADIGREIKVKTKNLAGLTLKNISFSIKENNRMIFSQFGDLLFTHQGISGPLVLTASALVGRKIISNKAISASIDLKPGIPDNELDNRLIDTVNTRGKMEFKSYYDKLLPKSLRPIMVSITGIDEKKRISELNKKERGIIYKLIREFPINIISLGGFNEAIITKGGVSVKEINPATMECKSIRGLYICGEILDIDALTGGYNLQCAFSTGYIAGFSAANV